MPKHILPAFLIAAIAAFKESTRITWKDLSIPLYFCQAPAMVATSLLCLHPTLDFLFSPISAYQIYTYTNKSTPIQI